MKETTDLSVLHTKLRLWLESCQTEVNGHIAMLERIGLAGAERCWTP